MAFKQHSLTRQNTTTTGTGDIALGGEVDGYWPFSRYYANGDTCVVAIRSVTQWEFCVARYNSPANTLTRQTVCRSTNGDALVNFSAGVKDVYVVDLLSSDLPDGVKALINSLLGLKASEVENDSAVPGATVKDALESVTRSRTKPIRLSVLPTRTAGLYKWNTTSHIQDNMTTAFIDGQWVQFAAWVDNDFNPNIARRVLPDGAWSRVSLAAVAGNALEAPFAEDDHNTINIAVDADGYIHVAGNHHDVPLRYIRSANPDDLSSWVEPGMTGSNEDSVTYPQFVKMRDGTLLFFYRNGVSGDGNTYLNRYNPDTQTWQALHAPLIDGNATSENAYLWHIAVDADDAIHIVWCWRGTGDRDTNNDLCYAVSRDAGDTWEKTNGSSYTIPITHASADLILDTAGTGSGLLNQCGMECDSTGRPHVAFFLRVAGITQIHHAYLDAGTWHIAQLTSFTVDTTDVTRNICRPGCFVTPADRVYIYYTSNRDKLRGCMRVLDVTPGAGRYDRFRMMDFDLHEAEVVFDTQALYQRGEIHMLVHPAINGPQPAEEAQSVWRNQVGIVVSYDLALFDEVQAGRARLPAIEPYSHGSFGDAVTVSTTATVGTGAKVALPANVLEQGLIFVRHQCRGYRASGSGYMAVRIYEDDEEDVDVASLAEFYFRSSTRQNLGSPWVPLRLLNSLDYGTVGLTGYVSGQAYMSASGAAGVINIHNIQIGVLRLDE